MRAFAVTVTAFLFYRPLRSKASKAIYVAIPVNFYQRYLYVLLKFFSMQGYTIYVKRDLRLFHHILANDLSRLLFQERIVHLGKPRAGVPTIVFDDNNLSADYYRGIEEKKAEDFLVPMCQHPLMYHWGLWDLPWDASLPRKRSLFMAGNFNPQEYRRIEEQQLFPILSRVRVKELCEEYPRTLHLNAFDELPEFLAGDSDHKILLLDRRKVEVHMLQLRNYLARFDFFFALPGVVKPESHNIVEAMSAGAIPFLQRAYAQVFSPELEHGINAVIFEDERDLFPRIEEAFAMSDPEVASMRRNVIEYYQQHMTPSAIVAKFEQNAYRRVFLQSEDTATKLLLERRRAARQHPMRGEVVS